MLRFGRSDVQGREAAQRAEKERLHVRFPPSNALCPSSSLLVSDDVKGEQRFVAMSSLPAVGRVWQKTLWGKGGAAAES